MEWSQCPICKCGRQTTQIYPYALCYGCKHKTVTRSGQKIHFGMESIDGRCIGFINGNSLKTTKNTTCYVDGVKCFATAYNRFGGVVVSVDMLVRKIMKKWKRKAKAIGMIMIVYWQAVQSANAPRRKQERGEFELA
mgnify:CR=1 FL=1|tara:strand:+ start:3360 stop:3770 length:411 start_codon:yes stop_codon:yes gene_type:complete